MWYNGKKKKRGHTSESAQRIYSTYECMFMSRKESDAREYFYQLCATSGDYYSVGILRQHTSDDFPVTKTYDYDQFMLWTRKKI